MLKNILFACLITSGIINALVIVILAITGPNAYTIANNLSNYFNLVLCIIPLILLLITVSWYILDLIIKPEKRINYFALAFCAISADAVFVIGSLLFAE
ncbi:MAG: hypothetical protein IPL10_07150 [Bacteroidetes bacterium]|nr:hypothetical protein [Bacteroidota bacterium]